MIGKIFPRILNKSSEKTAIKSSEFSDALNVLVTGDDGGDSNIISKADGNISAVVNDPENFPINGASGSVIKESVIGKYEDEIRNRIYYFSYGEDGTSGYSSIYLLEEVSPQDYRFALLMREKNSDTSLLNFSFDDFVPANVIQTPILKKEFFRDVSNSGDTGDTDSSFDFDGGGVVEGQTNLQLGGLIVDSEVNVFDQLVDGGSQEAVANGTLTILNLGTAPGEVSISAAISNNVNFFSIFIQTTATIAAGSSSVIPFSVIYDPQGGATEDQLVEFVINVTEIQTVTAVGTLPDSANGESLFIFPQPVTPSNLIIRGPQSTQPDGLAWNTVGPSSQSSDSFIDFGEALPETQYASVLGPFDIYLAGWGEDGNPLPFVAPLAQMRVRLSFQGSQDDEQGASEFWEIVPSTNTSAISDVLNDFNTPTFTDFENNAGIQNQSVYTNDEQLVGSFYIRKSHDTNDWISDGLDVNVETVLHAEVQYQPDPNFAYIGFSVGNGDPAVAVQSNIHSIYAGATIADVQTPANLVVTDISWVNNGVPQQLFDIPVNVDDGSGENEGGAAILQFNVTNLGETTGFYFVSTDWATSAWGQLSGLASSPAAFQSAVNFGDQNLFEIWKGAYELTTLTYGGTASRPYSQQYLSTPGIAENSATSFDPYGEIEASPTFVEVAPGATTTVFLIFSNSGSEFAYGSISQSDLSDELDLDITGYYEGVSGPFAFWGTPLSAIDNGQSFPNKDDWHISVFALNLSEGEDVTNFTEEDYVPIWSVDTDPAATVQVTVGDDYLGNMVVSTMKTPVLDSPDHPLIQDISFQEGSSPILPLSAWMDMMPFAGGRIQTGPLTGQRVFYPGIYYGGDGQGTFESIGNAASSGSGVANTAQTDSFWINHGSFGQNAVDLVFTNTTSQAGVDPVNLSIKLEPMERWWTSGENGNGTNGAALGLQPILRTREWSGEGFTLEKHQATLQNGGPGGNFNVMGGGLGSTGYSVVFTNPIPLQIVAGAGSIDPEGVFNPLNGTTQNYFTTDFNGNPSVNFPTFTSSDSFTFGSSVSGLAGHGTLRRNSIQIPARTAVIARIVFKWNTLGPNNPDEGIEDVCQGVAGVDYTDPMNAWGFPCIIRASWTGGVQNEQNSLANIGIAVGVPSFDQYNNMV